MGHVIRVEGETLSPLVDCTYVFLPPSGVYLYSCRLNMTDPGYRKEVTGIFGYGDVKDIGIVEGTAVRTYGKGFAEHPVSVTFTRLVLTVGEERMYFPCTRDSKTEEIVVKAKRRIAEMKG